MALVRDLGVLVLLCAALTAQRTFIVDQQNGPGTNYVDIVTALGSAQHGDVFLVRAGSYAGATTDKGVSLLAIGNVSITSALGVRNLPAGRTCSIEGFSFSYVPSTSWILCDSNAGSAHFESLVGSVSFSFSGTALKITSSGAVTVSRCSFMLPIDIADSTVALLDTSAIGNDANLIVDALPGLRCQRSTVQVVGGNYVGGKGWSMPQPRASGEGIKAVTGSLRLGVADQPLILTGGFQAPNVGASALGVAFVQVTLDPAVTLSPTGSAPPITNIVGSTFTTRPVPTLAADQAVLGGTATTRLFSQPGYPFFLAVGLLASPTPLLWSSLYVDVSTFVGLGTGLQAAGGSSAWLLPVPNDLALRGQVLCFQAASADPGFALTELTNPSAHVFH